MTLSVLLLAVAAFAVLILLGFFTVSFFWPEELSRGLIWAFAPAVGAGICSLIYVVFRRPMFTVELSLLLALAAAYFIVRRPSLASRSFNLPRLPPSVFLLALGLGIALSQCLVVVERAPHGDWDATAIWNSHARVLYRDGTAWQTHIGETLHADYPLLVPSLVARLWRYLGVGIPDAASASGAVFVFAAIGVLAGVLAELRSTSVAVVMGLILTGTPFFIHYGVAQSADVPLSLYVLSTVALICLYRVRAPEKRGLLVLAGFTAGCAAWVKNEGMLFILAVAVVLLLPALRKPAVTLRRFAAFAAGAMPPLLVILWFKLTVAPANDIVGNRNIGEIIAKLWNPDRHMTILRTFSHTFWNFGDWLLNPAVLLLIYIAVSGIDRKMIRNAGWIQGLSACLFVVAGYYFVYVVTPMDLQWHLDSSLPRLCLHLWPAALLLAGLTVRQSENPLRLP